MYKVVSCEPQQVEIDVTINKKPLKALVDATIAQLLPLEENGSGTMKVAVDPEFLEMFEVGKAITVEFSVN